MALKDLPPVVGPGESAPESEIELDAPQLNLSSAAASSSSGQLNAEFDSYDLHEAGRLNCKPEFGPVHHWGLSFDYSEKVEVAGESWHLGRMVGMIVE